MQADAVREAAFKVVDFQDVGYGSAAATMLFLIIALITAVYLTVARVGRED